MHTVRHDPTRLQPCRRVRGGKNTTRLPTLNPEEPYFCTHLIAVGHSVESPDLRLRIRGRMIGEFLSAPASGQAALQIPVKTAKKFCCR